jgi:anti-anti-sigma factor
MNFKISYSGDVIIIEVKVDRATMREVDEFRNMLMQEIERGSRKIIIDLSECYYIDSTFLGVLVLSLKRVKKSGGDIKLVTSNSITGSLLQITGAAGIFAFHSSKEEALLEFGK